MGIAARLQTNASINAQAMPDFKLDTECRIALFIALCIDRIVCFVIASSSPKCFLCQQELHRPFNSGSLTG